MEITVGELIGKLLSFDPDDLVVLASDSEGNNFSPLYELTEDLYQEDSNWSGNTCPREITDELRQGGWTEEDIMPGRPCITLWPTN